MKVIDETKDGESLEALMGQRITLFCMNYIYTGKLIGVNTTCVKLSDPAIVYETGSFTDKAWKDAQALPNDLYISTAAIEAFGVVK
jgi:hypothetical protein